MKLIINPTELRDALAIVGRAVSSRSTLPILSNILIEADDTFGLILAATNLECAIRTTVPCEVAEPGRTTLAAKLFSEIVGSFSGVSILTVESDAEDHVKFHGGRGNMEVNGLPADEYPVILSVAGTTLEVPNEALLRMLQATGIAVSGDETRARLTGMLFLTEGDGFRTVATDTHRMATCSNPVAGLPENVSEIIPGRALKEVERLLRTEGTCQVTLSSTQAAFTCGATTLVTRLIEGEFPSYRKTIPAVTDWTVTFGTQELREAVKRVNLVTREDNHKMVLRVHPHGVVELSGRSSKTGHCDEQIMTGPPRCPEGAETLEIALNAEYMLEELAQMQSDEVTMELTAANQPVVLRQVGGDALDIVQMPMQRD